MIYQELRKIRKPGNQEKEKIGATLFFSWFPGFLIFLIVFS